MRSAPGKATSASERHGMRVFRFLHHLKDTTTANCCGKFSFPHLSSHPAARLASDYPIPRRMRLQASHGHRSANTGWFTRFPGHAFPAP